MAENEKRLFIRVTDSEYERLMKMKERLRMPSYGSTIRMMINSAVYFRIDFDGLFEVGDQIRRIGQNIDQITKHVNTFHEISPFQLELLKRDMDDIRKQVAKITDDKIKLTRYMAREPGGDADGDSEDNQG